MNENVLNALTNNDNKIDNNNSSVANDKKDVNNPEKNKDDKKSDDSYKLDINALKKKINEEKQKELQDEINQEKNLSNKRPIHKKLLKPDDVYDKPDDVIVRDIGYYNIHIDKDNKVTVISKFDGSNKNEEENVIDAFRRGNLVYIYLKDGT